MKEPHETVFVVIRVDHHPGLGTPAEREEPDGPGIRFSDYRVTVKEVVTTVEEAKREAERLNALNGSQRVRYFWTGGHYFPGGGSHGSRAT